MMKTLGMVVLISLMGASVGFAQLNTGPDVMGIYFDYDCVEYSTEAAPFGIVPAYIMLHDPTFNSILGYEFSYSYTGNIMISLTILHGNGPIDVGGASGNHIVGLSTPMVTSDCTLLCTLSVFLMDANPVHFTLHGATPNSVVGSVTPCVLLDGDVIVPVDTPSWDEINQEPSVCAVINDPDFFGPVPPPSFSVEITATTGSLVDTNNIAGTSLSATDGYDPNIDIPEPGPIPSGYVNASFMHADWPIPGRYVRDVRANYDALEDTKVWPFSVETDQTGTVTLEFSPSFTEVFGASLYLQDMSNGQFFNLYPALTYTYTNSGPSVRDFQLAVGGSTTPAELDPPSRLLEPGWQLIGLPMVPLVGSSTLDDVILEQAPGYAYVYDFAGTGGYQSLDGAEHIQYGTGYWLATDTAFDWSMGGTLDHNGITIELAPGWNLVGNPMWFPCPVDGIQVNHNTETHSWQEAVSLGLVSPLMDYNQTTDSYFQSFDLEAWHGYWFRALSTGISLNFDWTNLTKVPDRLVNVCEKAVATDSNWSALIHASVPGEEFSRTVIMGVDPTATADFDPKHDLPAPPASPRGSSRLEIQHPEWNLPGGNSFFTDRVHPEQESMAWNIALSARPGENATLSWDRANWPADLDLQLYLPDENRVVVMSMADQSMITLPVEDGNLLIQVRTPNLMSGVEDLPTNTWRLGAYPNPFNPRTKISFDLERDCRAEVRVYSVRGELVQTVGAGDYSAGTHEIVWEGKDSHGRSVPSGSYFARLIADGDQVGKVIKMSLVR